MGDYDVSNDFLEIIAGTNNKINKSYMEAAKDIDSNTSKSMGYLKNFITSIEKIADKDSVKDSRISESKGNITSFSGYENIEYAIKFLSKNLGKIEIINNLKTIHDVLKQYRALYSDGYTNNVRLVVLEYESAVYLLVTGLSLGIAEGIEVVQNGTQIKIRKRGSISNSLIVKNISDMAKHLSSRTHKEYLEGLIKAQTSGISKSKITESTTMLESVIADTIDLIDSIFSGVGRIAHVASNTFRIIKKTLFGVIPLIRSVLYLRYKKKADTVLRLEEQIHFIHMNIEQLQNINNMDPEKKAIIIKKQEAIAKEFERKAAKLRAELIEGEKDAATAIKQENPDMKNVDDEFVLENGMTAFDIFPNDEDDISFGGE